MKVLLINPSQKEVYGKMNTPDYPPLGLAYIGAVLENNKHEVKIIDIDAEKLSDLEIVKLSRQFDIVGLTATTPTFKNAEEVMKMIKLKTKKITILGGIHATISYQDCIKSKYIDFVVRGEGEITIGELINAIEKKGFYSNIDGLSYKDEGVVIHNKDRELTKDLDKFPFPARHLFNQQKYNYPDSLKDPVMPIMSSRGCPHNCTYCCTKLIFTRRVRFRSAKNVVDEIESLIEKYGVKEIHFWDDNFTLNKKRVYEIKEEILKREIKLAFAFPNGLRVDQVDKEILTWLKEMGTYSVAFGVESGNQRILDNVKKGITLERVREAFKEAREVGLEVWAFFMIGLYGETAKTIRDTIDFAKELSPDIAKFHILKPFPSTVIFNQLLEDGNIIERDFSKYGIHTPPVHRLKELSADDLLMWSKKAYKEFYLRPSIIFKQIKRLRSFARFKLNFKTGMGILRNLK